MAELSSAPLASTPSSPSSARKANGAASPRSKPEDRAKSSSPRNGNAVRSNATDENATLARSPSPRAANRSPRNANANANPFANARRGAETTQPRPSPVELGMMKMLKEMEETVRRGDGRPMPPQDDAQIEGVFIFISLEMYPDLMQSIQRPHPHSIFVRVFATNVLTSTFGTLVNYNSGASAVAAELRQPNTDESRLPHA
jgi:hypothetical protein